MADWYRIRRSLCAHCCRIPQAVNVLPSARLLVSMRTPPISSIGQNNAVMHYMHHTSDQIMCLRDNHAAHTTLHHMVLLSCGEYRVSSMSLAPRQVQCVA